MSDNAKSEVFVIIYLFMNYKQQYRKERDIFLTQDFMCCQIYSKGSTFNHVTLNLFRICLFSHPLGFFMLPEHSWCHFFPEQRSFCLFSFCLFY